MQDNIVGSVQAMRLPPEAAVSPDNPCPFLRAVVAEGFVDGHIVPISKLCKTVEAASGETGLQKIVVGMKTYLVALVANGLSPLRLLRSWWSGAELDALRNGPLDKHGVGSRILDATAHVDEAEIARLAEFGKDRQDPCGGHRARADQPRDHGLHGREFRARQGPPTLVRPAVDERRMAGFAEYHGQGRGRADATSAWRRSARCSSIGGCRTGSTRGCRRSRRLPAACFASSPRPRSWWSLCSAPASWRLSNSPTRSERSCRRWRNCCRLRCRPALRRKEAHWLDQNWSTEDRHWFHHASQGTATFPVPYSWFVALEQPGIHLFTRPGMLADSDYLERFGFLPSPKTIDTDEATLRRFGYSALVRRQVRARTGARARPASRRRSIISTACRSALRG